MLGKKMEHVLVKELFKLGIRFFCSGMSLLGTQKALHHIVWSRQIGKNTFFMKETVLEEIELQSNQSLAMPRLINELWMCFKQRMFDSRGLLMTSLRAAR